MDEAEIKTPLLLLNKFSRFELTLAHKSILIPDITELLNNKVKISVSTTASMSSLTGEHCNARFTETTNSF